MLTLKKRLVYITRDIERALGTTPYESYIIITNRTPYAEKIKNRFPDFVHFIDSSSDDIDDTLGLLRSDKTREIIATHPSDILIFKNNIQTETEAKLNSWNLLNPPAKTAEHIENKISQVEWMDGLENIYLPPHTVCLANDIPWQNKPIVIQWAHGHTGESTILVNSRDELKAIQTKFPKRMARTTEYINGPSFTVNVIVAPNAIMVGNVSYQITGLAPFTDNPFSTVGNDWSITHNLLSEDEHDFVTKMARDIGEKMRKSGWKGLFGIDIIRDTERNKIFMIEINARQPASTSFESVLQESYRNIYGSGVTVFEAHVMALLNQSIDLPLITINDGAQIVQRITKKVESVDDDMIGSLELSGYEAIIYPNTQHNCDLLRIKSTRGIMENHGTFNIRGKKILDIISA